MGLIPRSNHLSLIKDCYPPAPSSSAPTSEIPSPVSNALGKLSFYAVNRPKKLPKVLNVLLERATKDKHSSGTKARQDLGVTLDIIRGLVVECGENGKDGAGELIKAVAEEALRAAEMGLSGEGGVKGKKRDPEMEAKGASLFATIATLLSPPFFGLQEGFGKQYLRCLSLVSDLAQLKGPEAENSRFVALQALQAAARSDILYQTAGDFELQAEYLASALVANCYHTPVHDLRTLFNTTDAETGTSRLAGSLPSRKPPTITAPSSPPSQHDLASIAVPTLRSLARLSDSSQLLSLHNAISTFLNRHRGGELWHGNSQSFVEWLASSLLSASAPSYRPGVLGWWVDQVGEIYDAEPQHKSVTLLYVLASLLRGKTNLHGMGVGGVLNTLGELLIRRARVSNRIKPPPSPTKPINGTQPAPPTDSAFATDQHHVDYPQDRDLLTRPILSTISALSSKIYYADQLDNLISDLIDLLKGLRLEEGGGLNKEEKVLAATKLVVAMRLLLEEAHRGHGRIEGGEKKVGARERSRSRPREKEVSEATVKNGGLNEKEGTKLEDESLSTRPYLPPPVGSGETLKTNGLILGQRKSIENGTRPDEDFTIRGKKESVERPSIIVDDGARLGQSPTQPSPVGNRKRVSPRTFEKSLFILTVGDSTLRAEYVRATIVYLEKELDVRGLESTTTLPPDLAYFWKSLHSNCYTLATAPSLSATHQTPPATANPADLTHPLTRVRSQRSLRGLSLDSTISRPTINTNNLSPPTGPAAPFDYSSILRLLQAVHRLNSSTALLEGVPMLITLDRQAAEWETGSNGRERSGERAQATREVAAATITQIGRTWRINEVEQIGREALESTTPSVIPSFDSPHHDQTSFATRATAAPAAFNSQMIVDAIAFSDSLQSATGLDRTSLASLLGANWTPELASRVRSSSFVSPYVNGGASVTSRSVLQLPLGSSVRIPSNASTHNSTSPHSRGPGSLNTPSLADLQSSLGGGGGGGGGSPSVGTRSARQSQTPSLVSGNGGSAPGSRVSSMYTGMSESSPSKRRTNKMSAETLLASVGRRGRVGTNSSMSSQL